MYKVLLDKMKGKDIIYKMLADVIGCSESTIKNKINGRTEFTFSESVAIRDYVAPEMTVEELFVRSDDSDAS